MTTTTTMTTKSDPDPSLLITAQQLIFTMDSEPLT